MSDPMICADRPSAISSPASADGLGRYESQDGPTTDLFGPVPVRANLSPSQAKDLGLMTRDTSGLHGTGSLRSDALQSSLESRLRARLTGSVSCDITWKRWDTPWGQCLSKPRARVRTTFGIVVGLWPTMTSNAPAREGYNEAGNSAGQVAIRKILIALYPTATARDWKSGAASPRTLERNSRPLNEFVVALWSTIRASDGAKGGPNMSFGAGGSPLPSQVSTVANTSNAPMESGGGSLHPEFAGWEMGYPPEWLSCAPSETPSTRGQRQRSSAPRVKRFHSKDK
jgi:hypothetical protein